MGERLELVANIAQGNVDGYVAPLRAAPLYRRPGATERSRGAFIQQRSVLQKGTAMENVEAVVCNVIAAKLRLATDRVVPEARIIEDLGATSLDSVDTIMALEDAFGLDINDAEAERLKTVGDVIVLMTMKSEYRDRALAN